jgi:hypothetical protein
VVVAQEAAVEAVTRTTTIVLTLLPWTLPSSSLSNPLLTFLRKGNKKMIGSITTSQVNRAM